MIKMGIDLDGVICDMIADFLIEAKKRHNLEINKEDLTDYDVWDATSISRDQAKGIYRDGIFLAKLGVVPGAEEYIYNLYTAGVFIHIITARYENRKISTEGWLSDNSIVYDMLSFVPANTKAKFAERNGIDVFIEDKYSTALDLGNVCRAVFLIDYPWNQGVLPRNVYRVSGWKSIINHGAFNGMINRDSFLYEM